MLTMDNRTLGPQSEMVEKPEQMGPPSPPMGAHAALKRRIEGADLFGNPVLDAEPFDESLLGDDINGSGDNQLDPSSKGLAQPPVGIDNSAPVQQQREMSDEEVAALFQRAIQRKAASKKYQTQK